MYINGLAAPETVNMMPEANLLALADHGQVPSALPVDGGDCKTEADRFGRGCIDAAKLAGQLERNGGETFVKGRRDLTPCIEHCLNRNPSAGIRESQSLPLVPAALRSFDPLR